MNIIIIAKRGFDDLAVGRGDTMEAAFEAVMTNLMHYAITEKMITDSTNLGQRNCAVKKIKPSFEVRYIG
jgi:hypothetical protein